MLKPWCGSSTTGKHSHMQILCKWPPHLIAIPCPRVYDAILGRARILVALDLRFKRSAINSEVFHASRGKYTRHTLRDAKAVGYAKSTQVRLYGEVFELLSDPFTIGENAVFVDGIEQRSGRVRRVRIPVNLVQMANKNRAA